jgi:hypothetical protein
LTSPEAAKIPLAGRPRSLSDFAFPTQAEISEPNALGRYEGFVKHVLVGATEIETLPKHPAVIFRFRLFPALSPVAFGLFRGSRSCISGLMLCFNVLFRLFQAFAVRTSE